MTRTLRLVDEAAPEGGERPLRIAIATNDLEHLNAHFGSARKFAIYDVTTTNARFVGAAGFDDVTAQAGRHDDGCRCSDAAAGRRRAAARGAASARRGRARCLA